MSEKITRPRLADTFRNRAELMPIIENAALFPRTGWADRRIRPNERFDYVGQNVYEDVRRQGYEPGKLLGAWLLKTQNRMRTTLFGYPISQGTLDMTDEEYPMVVGLRDALATEFVATHNPRASAENKRDAVNRVAEIRQEIKAFSDAKRRKDD